MARQGQALRGRPARFIGTITVGGGEVPAAGKHSKDDVNSPERESSESSFAQRVLKELKIPIIKRNDLMDDYDDELGEPLIPTDTRASEALTQKSSLQSSC